jgi:lipopolysaccharide/colanic/teichoic acid biosynthesis glycosyltransferase
MNPRVRLRLHPPGSPGWLTPTRSVRTRGTDAGGWLAPNVTWTRLSLPSSDALAVIVAVVLANTLLAPLEGTAPPTSIWLAGGLCLALFALAGLYPGAGLGAVEELRRVALLSLGVHATLIATMWVAGVTAGTAYLTALASWALVVVLVPAGRAALRALVAEARRLRVRRALIVTPETGPADGAQVAEQLANVFGEIAVVRQALGPASSGMTPARADRVLIPRGRRGVPGTGQRVLKRLLDLVILIPMALVAGPVVFLSAAAIMIVSPGRPFYAQRREGRDGRPVDVWKLRTMHPDADALLAKHFEAHPEARDEWNRYFKLKDDPRILPWIGTFLRKTSIDELPQLWNIARGDMTFVGPRPFPAYHLDGFSSEFRALRRTVAPGLTGLWQVSARSDGDLQVQEELDSHYIQNWSIWLDLYLLARTPFAVLFTKGAY